MRRSPVNRISLYRHAELVLGTFNAVLLVLFLTAWFALDEEAGVSPTWLFTPVGLALVIGLWALAWWTTGRAIRGWNIVPLPPWWATWQRGILHGARAGLIAMATLTSILLVLALFEDGLTSTFGTRAAYTALYIPIWVVIALIVGAAAGFVLATIDRIVVGLALRA